MAKVIVRKASYDYEILKRHCFDILDEFCGDLIKEDSFVVIKPDFLLTNKVSKELGFFEGPVEVDGDLPKIRDFLLPGITPLTMGPGWAPGFIRQYFLQRPEADESQCRLCGKCSEFCPAGALVQSDDKLLFDYDNCIRCYCCVEVCPHGALHTREPLGGRLLRKFICRS